VVKEGVYQDDDNREAIARVCMFHSTAGEEVSTLPEVVARLGEGQESLHYLAGKDLETLRASPLLAAYKERGWEVLLLGDSVDEFALERLKEFDGKPLKCVERGDSDLESEDERKQREEREEEQQDLLKAVLEELDEYVGRVRFSGRLGESPAALVSEENAPSRSQERLMRELGQAGAPLKRVLELNSEHPLVEKLGSLRTGEDEQCFGDLCELLHGQALLAEGSALPDPAYFSEILTRTMLR